MKTILIVDDEIEIVELLKIYLSNNNFKILEAYDGEEAFDIYHTSSIDMIILDIMMPKIDGINFIKQIRKKTNIPIMFLSAKNEDMDVIHGLGLGGDDYMSKPFNPLEVVARVQALLRRYQHLDNNARKDDVVIGNLLIDQNKCKVYKSNREIEITSMEYKLLNFFMQNTDQVFTKRQLYEQVWGQDYIGDDNIIMVYISKLREKIEQDPRKPSYIKTIRGLGYRFERISSNER